MAWTSPKTYRTGDVLTAADLNTYQRDNFEALAPNGVTVQTFTPTLDGAVTDPTLGSGSTASGLAYRIGKLAIVHMTFIFGTSGTSAGSGDYLANFSALGSPFNLNTNLSSVAGHVGSGYAEESGGNRYVVAARYTSGNTVRIPYDGGGNVGAAAPFAWGANDLLKLTLTYVTT